jgi:hypothetical protein
MKYIAVMKDQSQGGYIAALTMGEKFLEGWGATAEEAVEDLASTAVDAGLVNSKYYDDELGPYWEMR